MRVVLAVSALLLLCLAPMLSAAGPPVAKSEFKVTDIGDSTNEIVQLAKQDIVGQPTPPANVKGKPAKGTGTMTYYEVQAHGTQIPLAVDYTPGSSKLYVATDGSGDLSRCPPLQSWQLPSKNHAFPAFQVKIGEDKVGLKVEVMGPNRLLAYPATMLGGTVKFGDKPYRVLLVDAELDGSYNHYYAERAPTGTRTSRAGNAQMGAVMSNGVAPGVPPYDIFAIDLKGTGKIEPEVGGVMEAMPLPKMLRRRAGTAGRAGR